MADAIRQIGVSEGDLLSVAPGVCRAEDRASCRGIPAYIRFDNGPQFVAKAVQELIAVVSAKTAYIERGSPWENGYIESFNARLRASCSTAKSSILSARPKSLWRAGSATTTKNHPPVAG